MALDLDPDLAITEEVGDPAENEGWKVELLEAVAEAVVPDGVERLLDVQKNAQGGHPALEPVLGLLDEEEEGVVGGAVGAESKLMGTEYLVFFAVEEEAAGDDLLHQFADDRKEGDGAEVGRKVMRLERLGDQGDDGGFPVFRKQSKL